MSAEVHRLLRERQRLEEEFDAWRRDARRRMDETTARTRRDTDALGNSLAWLCEGWRGPKAIRLMSSSDAAVFGLRNTARRAVDDLEDEVARRSGEHQRQLESLDRRIASAIRQEGAPHGSGLG